MSQQIYRNIRIKNNNNDPQTHADHSKHTDANNPKELPRYKIREQAKGQTKYLPTLNDLPPAPTDQFKTFYGHKFNVVAMNWFPFTKFIQHSEEGGTVVTPQDSLDIRMLNALAKALNFT